MLKNISNLGKTLNKKEQKEVKGGLLGLASSCKYECSGTSYKLVGGQGQDCYLNNPAIIHNHPNCGGGNDGGNGGGGNGGGIGLIEVWA